MGETNTEGGAAIGGDAKAGRSLTGRDTHERQSQRAGDTYYGGQGGDNMALWVRILDIAADINALTVQINDLLRRMGRMEQTEVVVRPGTPDPEVIFRPMRRETDSINLPVKTVIIILVVALLLVVLMVIVLFLNRIGYV